MMIQIRKGLDLPIEGAPRHKIDTDRRVSRVAIVASDYVGMKPKVEVVEGERVQVGQVLISDKRVARVRYTAPGCGIVVGVHRGAKRRLLSVEIELDGEDQVQFRSYADQSFTHLSRDKVIENLTESGLWTALRTRPFSRVPSPDSVPHSIFVSAIDTNPLAASPASIIDDRAEDFRRGLQLLSRLTDGKVFVCIGRETEIPDTNIRNIQIERFSGPHPAGLAGTHIHFLDPVGLKKMVWWLNYQDVIAFGQLFVTGHLPVERVISLAGPAVSDPRLIRTRIGASIDEMVDGQLRPGVAARVISGSVLHGREAAGAEAFLGRHHLQVSALPQGGERVLMEWLLPGLDRFSIKNVYASSLFRHATKFAFTTSKQGSPRALVPIGMYEKVMPLDMLATYLLRALIVGDSEQAKALGCLELDEEDLALCSFVCPGKHDFGPMLRSCLDRIEKEG